MSLGAGRLSLSLRAGFPRIGCHADKSRATKGRLEGSEVNARYEQVLKERCNAPPRHARLKR